MSTYVYREVLNEILDRVQSLTFDDQLRLLSDIATMLRHEGKATPRPKHSIMELEGLGKEIWEGIDAQEYVNQERDAWRG
jgi:hypothetical protein